jgi:hypothetical protein
MIASEGSRQTDYGPLILGHLDMFFTFFEGHETTAHRLSGSFTRHVSLLPLFFAFFFMLCCCCCCFFFLSQMQSFFLFFFFSHMLGLVSCFHVRCGIITSLELKKVITPPVTPIPKTPSCVCSIV